MFSKYKLLTKLTSLALAVAFSLSEIAYAAPAEIGTGVIHESPLQVISRDPSRFEAPVDFVTLKEIHSAGTGDPAGRPFIIHIQDAHANLSGQQNLANALDDIMTRYNVTLVLVEGGSRDDTLTPIKEVAPPEVWKKVAKSFLIEGKISGEEYLNLISDHPMKIMGIEDRALYMKSLEAYADLAGKREEILEYLKKIQVVLDKLKRKLYPRELLNYEKEKLLSAAQNGNNGNGNGGSFETNFEGLLKLARTKSSRHFDERTLRHFDERSEEKSQKDEISRFARNDIEARDILSPFLTIQRLVAIQEKEKQIDFNLANLEQAALFEEIQKKGGGGELESFLNKLSQMKNQKAAQFAYFQNALNISKEKRVDISKYPNFILYGEYLKDFCEIDLEALLDEFERLEDDLYVSVISRPQAEKSQNEEISHSARNDALLIRAIDRYVGLLTTAYNIRMSTKEFNLFKANESDFSTLAYLAFINRKLAEQGYARDLVSYQNILEEGKKSLEAFYDSVMQRDFAFIQNAERILKQENQQVAVLISGGYHTPHLAKLFKEKGYSYVVLAPIVTTETNQKKYEKLLLAPVRTGQKARMEVVQGVSKSKGKSLSALEEDLVRLKKKSDGVRNELTNEPSGAAAARLAELINEAIMDPLNTKPRQEVQEKAAKILLEMRASAPQAPRLAAGSKALISSQTLKERSPDIPMPEQPVTFLEDKISKWISESPTPQIKETRIEAISFLRESYVSFEEFLAQFSETVQALNDLLKEDGENSYAVIFDDDYGKSRRYMFKVAEAFLEVKTNKQLYFIKDNAELDFMLSKELPAPEDNKPVKIVLFDDAIYTGSQTQNIITNVVDSLERRGMRRDQVNIILAVPYISKERKEDFTSLNRVGYSVELLPHKTFQLVENTEPTLTGKRLKEAGLSGWNKYWRTSALKIADNASFDYEMFQFLRGNDDPPYAPEGSDYVVKEKALYEAFRKKYKLPKVRMKYAAKSAAGVGARLAEKDMKGGDRYPSEDSLSQLEASVGARYQAFVEPLLNTLNSHLSAVASDEEKRKVYYAFWVALNEQFHFILGESSSHIIREEYLPLVNAFVNETSNLDAITNLQEGDYAEHEKAEIMDSIVDYFSSDYRHVSLRESHLIKAMTQVMAGTSPEKALRALKEERAISLSSQDLEMFLKFYPHNVPYLTNVITKLTNAAEGIEDKGIIASAWKGLAMYPHVKSRALLNIRLGIEEKDVSQVDELPGTTGARLADWGGRRPMVEGGRLADVPEGLCVTGDTLLPILKKVDGGRSKVEGKEVQDIPIKDVKEGDLVLSLNEQTQQIEPHRIKGLLDMGIKPVYKLTTASGRSIKTTANHPYLVRQTAKGIAHNGERRAENQDPRSETRDAQVSLRATGGSEAIYAQGEIASVASLSRNDKNAWVKVKDLKAGDEIGVPGRELFGSGPDSGLIRFNQEKFSGDFRFSFILEEIYRVLDNLFLGHLPDVDKYDAFRRFDIKSGRVPVIFIESQNYIFMLLSIVKNLIIRSSCKTFVYGSDNIQTSRPQGLHDIRVHTDIGKDIHKDDLRHERYFGRLFRENSGEVDRRQDILLGNARVLAWNFIDAVTGRQKIQDISYGNPRAPNTGLAESNMGVNGYSSFKRLHIITFTEQVCHAMGILSSEAHAEPAEPFSPILWDPIVSIEALGLEQVYDIEVEGTHNFIGNGIFAHNTAFTAEQVVSSQPLALSPQPTEGARLAGGAVKEFRKQNLLKFETIVKELKREARRQGQRDFKFPREANQVVRTVLGRSKGPYTTQAIMNLIKIVTSSDFTDSLTSAIVEFSNIPGIEKVMDAFSLDPKRWNDGARNNAVGSLREILAANDLKNLQYEDQPGVTASYRIIRFGGVFISDLLVKDNKENERIIEVKETHTMKGLLGLILSNQVDRYYNWATGKGTAEPGKLERRVIYVTNQSVLRPQKSEESARRQFYNRVGRILFHGKTELTPEETEEMKKYFRVVFTPTLPIFSSEDQRIRAAQTERRAVVPYDSRFHKVLVSTSLWPTRGQAIRERYEAKQTRKRGPAAAGARLAGENVSLTTIQHPYFGSILHDSDGSQWLEYGIGQNYVLGSYFLEEFDPRNIVKNPKKSIKEMQQLIAPLNTIMDKFVNLEAIQDVGDPSLDLKPVNVNPDLGKQYKIRQMIARGIINEKTFVIVTDGHFVASLAGLLAAVNAEGKYMFDGAVYFPRGHWSKNIDRAKSTVREGFQLWSEEIYRIKNDHMNHRREWAGGMVVALFGHRGDLDVKTINGKANIDPTLLFGNSSEFAEFLREHKLEKVVIITEHHRENPEADNFLTLEDLKGDFGESNKDLYDYMQDLTAKEKVNVTVISGDTRPDPKPFGRAAKSYAESKWGSGLLLESSFFTSSDTSPSFYKATPLMVSRPPVIGREKIGNTLLTLQQEGLRYVLDVEKLLENPNNPNVDFVTVYGNYQAGLGDLKRNFIRIVVSAVEDPSNQAVPSDIRALIVSNKQVFQALKKISGARLAGADKFFERFKIAGGRLSAANFIGTAQAAQSIVPQSLVLAAKVVAAFDDEVSETTPFEFDTKVGAQIAIKGGLITGRLSRNAQRQITGGELYFHDPANPAAEPIRLPLSKAVIDEVEKRPLEAEQIPAAVEALRTSVVLEAFSAIAPLVRLKQRYNDSAASKMMAKTDVIIAVPVTQERNLEELRRIGRFYEAFAPYLTNRFHLVFTSPDVMKEGTLDILPDTESYQSSSLKGVKERKIMVLASPKNEQVLKSASVDGQTGFSPVPNGRFTGNAIETANYGLVLLMIDMVAALDSEQLAKFSQENEALQRLLDNAVGNISWKLDRDSGKYSKAASSIYRVKRDLAAEDIEYYQSIEFGLLKPLTLEEFLELAEMVKAIGSAA